MSPGIFWMASSCGPSSHWHSAAPTCHVTLLFTLSWEIVTTSTTSGVSSEGVAHTGGRYGSVIIPPFLFALRHFGAKLIACVVVALLSYPFGHPRDCGSEYIFHFCNYPNQLRGMCHVICPYAHFLTARFPKVAINSQFVRTQIPRKFEDRALIPVLSLSP